MEARGFVLDEDRGSLPYALIHGEALVAAAAWALGEAGVVLVDANVPWSELAESLAESGEALVLHDPLCPMTPPDFIASCLELAAERQDVVVGVAPDGDPAAIWSPVVLPARVAAALDGYPATSPDALVALVARLRDAGSVELVAAPATARRVGSEEEVRELERLTHPAGPGD